MLFLEVAVELLNVLEGLLALVARAPLLRVVTVDEAGGEVRLSVEIYIYQGIGINLSPTCIGYPLYADTKVRPQ